MAISTEDAGKWGAAVAAFLGGIGLWKWLPKARAADQDEDRGREIETLRTQYESLQQDTTSDISELRRDQRELRGTLVELRAICDSLNVRMTRREVNDQDVHRDLSALRLMLTHVEEIAERMALRIQPPLRELPRD